MNEDESIPDGFRMTELGPLPEEWVVIPLNELLQEEKHRAKEYENSSEFQILSLTKRYGLINQEDRFKHRVAKRDVSNYKVVRQGHIVYNPYVIWEGAIHVQKNNKVGLVSPAYVVWRCLNSDPVFLDNLLRSKYMLNEYSKYSAGAVNRRRSIKKRDFLSIIIQLPPLPEQKRIASMLSTALYAINRTDAVIEAMRELKRSMMQHLFTCGPVSLSEAEEIEVKERVREVPVHAGC